MAEGGRTGFASVVTGRALPGRDPPDPAGRPRARTSATGPVLVFVGFLMVRLIKDIDFTRLEEGFPALLGLILMPLTFSITVGIGAAFITLRGHQGRAWASSREVHPLLWAVAIAFVVYFVQAWINSHPAEVGRRRHAHPARRGAPAVRPGSPRRFLYHRSDVRTDRAARRARA